MILSRDLLEQIRDAALAMTPALNSGGNGMDRLRARRYEALARAADDLVLDLTRQGAEALAAHRATASADSIDLQAKAGRAEAEQTEAELAELREMAWDSTRPTLEPGTRPEETNRLIQADEAAFRRQHPKG